MVPSLFFKSGWRMSPKKRNNKHLKKGNHSRGNPSRKPNPLVLIVCEGGETEPNYFTSIRQEKRLSGIIVKIVGTGSASKKLIEIARDLVSKEKYESVWCVFDCDDHQEIPQAFEMAKKNGFRIAFSNPSFELWYLLHFEYYSANIHRKKVKHKLNGHIKNNYNREYKKSMDMYPLILENQPEAIERARKLRQFHDDNNRDERDNPSTSVDLLIEYLNNLSHK